MALPAIIKRLYWPDSSNVYFSGEDAHVCTVILPATRKVITEKFIRTTTTDKGLFRAVLYRSEPFGTILVDKVSFPDTSVKSRYGIMVQEWGTAKFRVLEFQGDRDGKGFSEWLNGSFGGRVSQGAVSIILEKMYDNGSEPEGGSYIMFGCIPVSLEWDKNGIPVLEIHPNHCEVRTF